MNNNFTIISAPDDFYMSDALCRALEADGCNCLFNLRDMKNPEKPVVSQFNTSDTIVAIISNSLLNSASLCGYISSKAQDTSLHTFLLLSEYGLSIKDEWANCICTDATNGLTNEIIDKVKGIEPIPAEIPAEKEDEMFNPNWDPAENARRQKEWKIFKERYYPVMSMFPESVMENTIDDAKEAWSVPVFIMPFERGEQIPNTFELISSIQPNSMTLQRAIRYATGDGVPENQERAFSLLQEAYNKDNSDAIANYALGVFHECGIGCNYSQKKAMKYYSAAADAGFEPAKLRAALMDYFVNENSSELKELLQEAYQNEDLDAAYMLGVIAEEEERFTDAFNHYSEAAEMGHAQAQNAIAYMYYNGIGLEKDHSQALEWLSLSAKQGFPMAIWNQQMDAMNQLNHGCPRNQLDNINNIIDEVDALPYLGKTFDKFTSRIYAYNIGILYRRTPCSIETVRSWFKDCEFVAPYIATFNEQYVKEEARRKRIRTFNKVGEGIYRTLKFFDKL